MATHLDDTAVTNVYAYAVIRANAVDGLNFSAAIALHLIICTARENLAFDIGAFKCTYAKKGTNRKPTARQTENVALKDKIVEVLAGTEGGLTATQVLNALAEEFEGLTLPRVTAQLTALDKAKEITRFVDGKKALFKVA